MHANQRTSPPRRKVCRNIRASHWRKTHDAPYRLVAVALKSDKQMIINMFSRDALSLGVTKPPNWECSPDRFPHLSKHQRPADFPRTIPGTTRRLRTYTCFLRLVGLTAVPRVCRPLLASPQANGFGFVERRVFKVAKWEGSTTYKVTNLRESLPTAGRVRPGQWRSWMPTWISLDQAPGGE